MLDARFQNLLLKGAANGPWLASMLLASLIAVELARMAIGAFGASPLKTPQPDSPRRAVATQPPVDIQKVVAAHLFGVATADSTATDPANAPASTANLVLAGTIATQDPKHGVAIISDGGGPSKVFSVGDGVGGATVHAVYMDRVLLDRGGSLEALVLPRLLQGSQAAVPAARTSGVFGGDSRALSAAENLRRKVQQDPGILNEIMRTVPSYDNKAGKLRGFRAYPGHNRMIFAKLGLRPGDLVTAINGTPLDDPQRSQEVINTIQSSEHATVTIERAGQRQDITLNVANVAQQASKDLEIDSNTPAPGNAPPPVPNDNAND